MDAGQLSGELRNGTGGYLTQRRWVAGLSVAASAAMGLISLYQLGIIRHLPEPPFPRMDADRVDSGADAYERFATPDAALGLMSYALTLVLAAAFGKDRADRHPWVLLLFGGKLLFDTWESTRLIVVQTRKYHAYCSWCLLAAAASFASLPIALPELVHGARAWRDGGSAAA